MPVSKLDTKELLALLTEPVQEARLVEFIKENLTEENLNAVFSAIMTNKLSIMNPFLSCLSQDQLAQLVKMDGMPADLRSLIQCHQVASTLEEATFPLRRELLRIRKLMLDMEPFEQTDKSAICFFGKSGAGKSTFVSYLYGNKFEQRMQGMREVRTLIGQALPNSPVIGENALSETSYASLYSMHGHDCVLVDMPGSGDNRGDAVRLTNAISNSLLPKKLKKISALVLVAVESSFADSRNEGLLDALEELGGILKSNKKLENNVVIAISKFDTRNRFTDANYVEVLESIVTAFKKLAKDSDEAKRKKAEKIILASEACIKAKRFIKVDVIDEGFRDNFLAQMKLEAVAVSEDTFTHSSPILDRFKGAIQHVLGERDQKRPPRRNTFFNEGSLPKLPELDSKASLAELSTSVDKLCYAANSIKETTGLSGQLEKLKELSEKRRQLAIFDRVYGSLYQLAKMLFVELVSQHMDDVDEPRTNASCSL